MIAQKGCTITERENTQQDAVDKSQALDGPYNSFQVASVKDGLSDKCYCLRTWSGILQSAKVPKSRVILTFPLSLIFLSLKESPTKA